MSTIHDLCRVILGVLFSICICAFSVLQASHASSPSPTASASQQQESNAKLPISRRMFVATPEDVTFVEEWSTKYDFYKIGPLAYRGSLNNGVPQNEGMWGLLNDGVTTPNVANNNEWKYRYYGRFENGKAVGEHEQTDGSYKAILHFRDGIAYKYEVDDYSDLWSIKINRAGPDVATDKPIYYEGKRVKYTGELNKDWQPHDQQGTIAYENGKSLVLAFVDGKGAPITDRAIATYYKDVKIIAKMTEDQKYDGEVRLEGTINSNLISGTVYYKNGELDRTRVPEFTYNELKINDNLKGIATVRGWANIKEIIDGKFSGKNLTLVFKEFPKTQFYGDFDLHPKSSETVYAKPIGNHQVFEKENGNVKEMMWAKYSRYGDFIKGENYLERITPKAKDPRDRVKGFGEFTDPRNDKTYSTRTYSTLEGTYLTWMTEDLDYQAITDEVWSFARNGGRVQYSYYSKNTASYACPSGWRLPTFKEYSDVPISAEADKDAQQRQAAKISFLKLIRNGYVWKRFRETELHGEDTDIAFHLADGGYYRISEINFGSSYKTVEDNKYYICRCVKEEIPN